MKNNWRRLRSRMVQGERDRRDVTDPRVLAAMAAVPREEFVPDEERRHSYEERPLPIESGQTISQPKMVAMMTELLALSPDDRVLEIGTGSGYQAAVLRQLVDAVVSVERIPELADSARAALGRVGVTGVEVHCADGTLGWPDGAPYDAIVVTAGAPEVPPALVAQLTAGGRLVIPVGPRGRECLVRVTRTEQGSNTEQFGAVSFVRLVGQEGWADTGD